MKLLNVFLLQEIVVFVRWLSLLFEFKRNARQGVLLASLYSICSLQSFLLGYAEADAIIELSAQVLDCGCLVLARYDALMLGKFLSGFYSVRQLHMRLAILGIFSRLSLVHVEDVVLVRVAPSVVGRPVWIIWLRRVKHVIIVSAQQNVLAHGMGRLGFIDIFQSLCLLCWQL